MKKTRWFSSLKGELPVRDGIYEVRDPFTKEQQLFDYRFRAGYGWSYETIAGFRKSCYSNWEWRGVLKGKE